MQHGCVFGVNVLNCLFNTANGSQNGTSHIHIPSTSIQTLTQIKNQSLSTSGGIHVNNDAVDPSLLFVYLRCLEAIFESTPQATLQLVYVVRTSKFNFLFGISIIQSILSLTNSMLKSDNAYMTHDKWKNAKKKISNPVNRIY